MSERSGQRSAAPQDSNPRRDCPTCHRPWSADAFYANCAECKACKRERSRRNRAVQARKIAAFERLVEGLVAISGVDGTGGDAELMISQTRPSEGAC